MIILDISESEAWRRQQIELIENLAGEAFMPMCYGGKVRTIAQVGQLLRAGYEKVSLNTAALQTPALVRQAADRFGSQSIVVSIDVKKTLLGKQVVCSHMGQRKHAIDPVEHALKMEAAGAGELMVMAIDRDGTMSGYDIDLIKKISDAVSIPVIAAGGAGNIDHVGEVVGRGGASAAAAGSMFVYTGRHRAVLINYPKRDVLDKLFGYCGPNS